MRALNFIFILVLIYLISCSGRKADTQPVKVYEFLSLILIDTAIIKGDSAYLIADVSSLPPPLFKGREIDFVSEKLQEPDTSFLKMQFKKRGDFRTDSLSDYGFRIIRISELQPTVSSDSLWNFIHMEYGPGYYSVSRPIFNVASDKAYIKVGYTCGPLCGYGTSYILEKMNGKWVIKELLGFWES